MLQRSYRPTELVPAGPAVLKVVAAEVRDCGWRASRTNPHGTCLRLLLSAGDEYARLVSDVPLDQTRLIGQVAESAGCDPKEMTPEFLLGRGVHVVVSRYLGRSGEQKAGVGRWLPAPARSKNGFGHQH